MSNIELKGLKGLRNLNKIINDPISTLSISFKLIPIDDLFPGKYQPRKFIDNQELIELSQSIKKQGIIQPLIVRKYNNGYEIIAGERRWRASKLAGLVEVPVIVREIDDSVALAFALVENIQRSNLNPIEEALSFMRLKEEFIMTHEEISEVVGRSRVSVTNTIRLLSLSHNVKEHLQAGRLDMGHARALLTLSHLDQEKLAEKIVKNGLNVRDAEKLVTQIKESLNNHKSITDNNINNEDKYSDLALKLSETLSTKVSIKLNKKGSGLVVIKINSLDDIDILIKKLTMV